LAEIDTDGNGFASSQMKVREEEAAERRAYRQRNKLCLECGAPLGFWERLGGGRIASGIGGEA